jgi:hypothetical protein
MIELPDAGEEPCFAVYTSREHDSGLAVIDVWTIARSCVPE